MRFFPTPVGLLALPFVAFAACGGSAPPPTMQGQKGMLSTTAISQKCEEAAKGHDRPFVIEWDATDLASFEAKAARDTMVVKYEGCKMEVLYACSDPQNPARFGAYGTPQFTSGGIQGFDVKNEGELYARLPLGAATLSGRVGAGETLHLKYFVSGVSTDTRDAVYRNDLAAFPACAGATHFVWAYNVGAFELASSAQNSAEGSASLGNAGAGGKRAHQESSLGSGGRLESCDTQDQRACRVPIRLALRAITPGDNPAGAPSAAPAPGTVTGLGTPEEQASAARKDAEDKFEKGDGAGCLAGMNRAASLDVRLLEQAEFKKDRAICLMASGKCEDGMKDYRAALAAEDFKRRLVDAQLERLTRKEANHVCTATSAKNDADFVIRSFYEMKKAAAVPDGKKCAALIDALGPHVKPLASQQHGPDFDIIGDAQRFGSDQYTIGATCVARTTKKCADGLAIYRKQCAAFGVTGCEQIVGASWEQMTKSMNLGCK